jgi:hypothetical protein
MNCSSTAKTSDQWTIDDTLAWLIANQFENYSDLFKDHKIDGKALLTLTEDDLRKCLGIKVLGDIKRLSFAIKTLKCYPFKNSMSNDIHVNDNLRFNHVKYGEVKYFGRHRKKHYSHSFNSESSEYDDEDDDSDGYDLEHHLIEDKKTRNGRNSSQNFKPEAWKALVAMLYFFSVTWITSIVMVIVHDRVPDMQTYPPLPDIFLDNVPLIPWAFNMCELCGLTLFITWIVILIFHKHR